MYDRRTETLWRQFSGDPVIGPLAESGLKLEVLRVILTTWGQWTADHPDTTVLDIDTGIYPESSYQPEDDARSAYHAYRAQPDTMFPVWQRSGALPPQIPGPGSGIGWRDKGISPESLERPAGG